MSKSMKISQDVKQFKMSGCDNCGKTVDYEVEMGMSYLHLCFPCLDFLRFLLSAECQSCDMQARQNRVKNSNRTPAA